jgi:hypothetical protein
VVVVNGLVRRGRAYEIGGLLVRGTVAVIAAAPGCAADG